MTDLEAANRALGFLGVAPIGALADDTIAARTMNRMLPSTKRAVLSEFAWSFALKMEPLVASTAPPPPGFSVTFDVPADAVNVVQVYRGARIHLHKLHYIVQDGVICANEAAASVEYTYANEDLTTWSAAACEALCLRLASDAAPVLVGGQGVGFNLLEKYQLIVTNARVRSTGTENLAPEQSTHYIDSRD